MSTFSLGLSTYNVPFTMHAENRRRVCSNLIAFDSSNSQGLVFLESGVDKTRNDTDHEELFRQESYFHYLSGVKEPNFAIAIDVHSAKTTLFCPRLPASYAIIMGRIKPPSEFRDHYEVDDVKYVDELESFFSDYVSSSSSPKILLNCGENSDSGNIYPAPELTFKCVSGITNTTSLFPVLADSRVFKSPAELELMKHVSDLSSQSHVYTMRESKPGMTEWQQEAMFNHYSHFYFGCRKAGYTGICACGPNAATLHYGHAGAPNDQTIQEGDMCLLDMGSEYHCYGADITCSFPMTANRKFTPNQRIIYSAVLNAQLAVYEMLKPGTDWVECHKAAEKAILEKLIEVGVVQMADAAKVEELVEKRLGGVFMPHGLGHFIGIDTHDVGGYLEGHPKRNPGPGLKSLRTARIMQESMCLTVEPGCYFIDCVIDDALADPNLGKHINAEKIAAFRGTGGVRLEDVVAITADGMENYTNCPRTMDEVEHVLSGGKWPPPSDEAPKLFRKYLVK